MNDSTLSVIMPVFNQAQNVEAAIRRVLERRDVAELFMMHDPSPPTANTTWTKSSEWPLAEFEKLRVR